MTREELITRLKRLPERPWEARHGGQPVPVSTADYAIQLLGDHRIMVPFKCNALPDGRVGAEWYGDRGSMEVAIGPQTIAAIVSVSGEGTVLANIHPQGLVEFLKRIEAWGPDRWDLQKGS